MPHCRGAPVCCYFHNGCAWSDLMHVFAACPAKSPACRYSAGQEAHILFSVSVKAEGEAEELMQRLNGSSMPTINLSNIEAAQVRLQGPARRCIGPISTNRWPTLLAPALLQSLAGCCSLPVAPRGPTSTVHHIWDSRPVCKGVCDAVPSAGHGFEPDNMWDSSDPSLAPASRCPGH